MTSMFLAVGYINGEINLYDLTEFLKNLRSKSANENSVRNYYAENIFRGHRAEISSLDFSTKSSSNENDETNKNQKNKKNGSQLNISIQLFSKENLVFINSLEVFLKKFDQL